MSFPYNIRICQWIWSVHLWGMADIVDGHTQAPGKHLKWDVMCQTRLPSKQCHLFFIIYFVLSRYGEHEHIFFSRSPKRRRSRSNSRTRRSRHRRSRSRSRDRRQHSPRSRSQERREREKERERRQKGLPPPKSETLSSESESICHKHI